MSAPQLALFDVDRYADHGPLFALPDDADAGTRLWVVVRDGLQEYIERRPFFADTSVLSWWLLGRIEHEADGWAATSILSGGFDRNHGTFRTPADARRAVERGL